MILAELKVWVANYFYLLKRQKTALRQVVFTEIEGREVPCQPWPQVFYVSSPFLSDRDSYEIRPLTLGGLLRGLGKNFISINYWHFLHLLALLGFLKTHQGQRLSWSHWNWHPLRTREQRRMSRANEI